MDENKRLEIKNVFINNSSLSAMEIMDGFIWGKFAVNEHYNISDIQSIIDEVISESLKVEGE